MSQSQPPMPEYSPEYGGVQPQISPAEERQWGMISHAIPAAAVVLSAGTLGFVASLVVYLIYKDKGPFVKAHAANSLNVQISMLIWWVVAGIVTLFSLGLLFPILFVPPIWALVLHVMGALKANEGQWWQPPLTFKLVG